ncbi:hypothetical protein PV327_007989 [Microctonus hyperodae]|uniref:ABC-type glutathione-S-conjugate transporter n=1 Tax=Microctonus hyperodae TaxID=165561 RepID=A0AA39G0C9_MICHY|nr:hypothetical protein PV327_007989 [Microctonus hyperodae]
MENHTMNLICGSSFWDNNLTWYTDLPDLTPCFQNTVLVWAPCVFLFTFLFLEIYYLRNSKRRDIPYTWKFYSKALLTLFLIILSIIDFFMAVYNSSHTTVYSVSFITPCIKIVTFMTTLVLLHYNRKCGMQTSGLLFLFWFFLVLCGIVQFTSLLRNRDNLPDTYYSFISYMIYYPIVVMVFILNFTVDDEPKFSDYPPVKRPLPEQSARYVSRITFWWFTSMACKGFRKPLKTKDLWSMNPEDTASEVVPKFEKYWNKALENCDTSPTAKATFSKSSGQVDFAHNKKIASISIPLCRAFGNTFIFGAVLKLSQDIMIFISPQLLKLLIQFVEGSEPRWKGVFYSILLLLCATFQTLVMGQYFHRMYIVGMRIRTALVTAIYRKALKMSNTARKESTLGEIVNLMSVDAQKFLELTPYINMIWSAPLQIALALYFLWDELGASVLAGLLVMIILIPVNAFISNKVKTLQFRQMESKDHRVKLINEVLNGIKVLKLYAWEPSFEQQILKIRNKEIKVLKEAAYLNSATSFIWSCAPFLVSLVTFATYVYVDDSHVLDSKKAFVSLSLFNILRFPLSMLPMMIGSIVQAAVSVKRINSFMNTEDLDPNNVQHDQSVSHPLIIQQGNFSWDSKTGSPTLKNISLKIEHGQLAAIVGTVGSGKSSLVSAFLGEMDRISGRVNTIGSIAYVSQQAWIQNATMQENILFGKPLDKALYNRVIDACALELDIKMLPAGDQTEIGEKGINLSGGQKQRVALARAVYSNSDVYFLDDPLSAVDSHVGKHIFEKVIGPNGLLNKKTRVLVTHGVTYLPEVDYIIVLKDGEISEDGTYQKLMESEKDFKKFIIQHTQEVKPDESSNSESTEITQQLVSIIGTRELQQNLPRQVSNSSMIHSDSELAVDPRSLNDSLHRQQSINSQRSLNINRSNSIQENNGILERIGERIIEDEKTETGSVKLRVYLHYFKSVGWFLAISTIVMNIVFQFFSVGSNFWISRWSDDNTTHINNTADSTERNKNVGVYAALGLGQAVASFFCDLAPQLGCWLAARQMHLVMLRGVMRASLNFFDTTPTGRIISRFAKDVDVLDTSLPQQISDSNYCLFEVIATLFVISFSTPLFIFCIIPIGLVYYSIQRFYVATSRQLKRLESVSKSPIYSHFGESVAGAQTIRAYGVQERFIRESERRVDMNQTCFYPGVIANRWLSIRLETVGNMIIFFSAIFAVYGRETLTAGLVGLSVSYALQITQTLNWLVRMTSEVETNIVAVERVKEYADTPQEAPWEIPETTPEKNWPAEGKVEFRDFKVRYREGLDLVLHGLTFSVNGGEKIGIVGRTGAGKSSLTLSLFRIIEAAHGKIFIDGIDISKLGLHTLRSRLTIIPQDPVLFSGTLRLNLDPFNACEDSQIWQALEQAHLRSFVKSLPNGLHHIVSEGGDNLSVGQRQLICLARALLRKTKILILDEATAAVDLETDDLIQRTIKNEFGDSTILTIAHRLNTIIDSDRVIVLDKGKITEFDSPDVLLRQSTSAFYSMAKDAGLRG